MSLLQLYPDPERCRDLQSVLPTVERVDFIVIPGLNDSSNYGLTSIKIRTSGRDWYTELLPNDFPNSRILFFNYDPRHTFQTGFTKSRLTAVTLNVLNLIIDVRREEPLRPIIFLAHGIGGILVKYALVKAAADPRYISIRTATRGIAFFGTPHRTESPGVSLEGLVSIFATQLSLNHPPKSMALHNDPYILSGKRCDPTLCSADSFHKVWVTEYAHRLRSVVFYGGASLRTVPRSNAVLGLSEDQESVVKLAASNRDLWKFRSLSDPKYRIVKDKLSWIFEWISCSDPTRYNLEVQDLKWLRLLYPQEVRSAEPSIRNPVKGTFNWIWSHSSFRSWLQSKQSVLWLSGKPGSGKSTLARYISLSMSPRSDQVSTGNACDLVSPRSFAVASFFCDYADPPQTSEIVLRSLLHQILTIQPSLLRYVPPRIRQKRYWQGGMAFLLADSLQEIAKHRSTVLVIDGLDECDENVRTSLIGVLLDSSNSPSESRSSCAQERSCVCQGHSPTLKILVTSRQQDFLSNSENNFAEKINLSSDTAAAVGLAEDFQAVMRSGFGPFMINDKQLATLMPIANQLIGTKKTAGIFLWSSIVIKLLDCYSGRPWERDTLLAQLTKLPTELDDLYSSAIDSINSKGQRERSKALNLLEWITYARRPLSISELHAALVFEAEDVITQEPAIVTMDPNLLREQDDFEAEALISIFSSGLIEVRDSTVYFIHQSVKEYLESTLTTATLSAKDVRISRRSNINTRLGSLCQRYLIRSGKFNYSLATSSHWSAEGKTEIEFPFFSYAAAHWHDHVATVQSDIHSNNRLNSFCSPSSRLLQTWFRTWWNSRFKEDWELRRFPTYPTEGIVLSFLGDQPEIFGLLQRRVMKPDETTPRGEEWTPLMAASWSGHESVVDLLLSRYPGYSSHPEHSARALVCAIERGHNRIAQTITLAFSQPNVGLALPADLLLGGIASPLAVTVRRGALELALLLLKIGDNLSIDESWELPVLSTRESRRIRHSGLGSKKINAMAIAVSQNDVDMATLLLEHGAKLDGFDFISLAAQTGSLDVLEWLIGKTNGFRDSTESIKALQTAAYFNHTGVVKWLLENQVSSVVMNETIVRSLSRFSVGRGRVDHLLFDLSLVSSEDAFLDACEACSVTAVRLLLDAGISANVSRRGKTAIHHVLSDSKYAEAPAHESQRFNVLQLLLNRGADINRKDLKGNTYLHLAARRGEKRIANLLVSMGIRVNARDKSGSTAIDIIALQGDAEWIQTLLNAGARPSTSTWINVLSSGCVEAATCVMSQGWRLSGESRVQSASKGGFELSPSPPEAYQHFITCGYAPQCFEQALGYLKSKKILDIYTVRVRAKSGGSIINSLQHRWEKLSGRKWSWWPILPPMAEINEYEAWISWNCTWCRGREHRDIIPTATSLEIHALIDFLVELNQSWNKRLATKNQQNDLIERAVPSVDTCSLPIWRKCAEALEGMVLDPNPDGTNGRQQQVEIRRESNDHSNRSEQPQKSVNKSAQDNSSLPDQASEDSTSEESSDDDDPGRQQELKHKGRFVVVKPGSFPHENIDVGVYLTDNQFLNGLLMVYRQRRGWIKAYFSIYRFHHWSFDKFEHLNGNYTSMSTGCATSTHLPEPPFDINYDFKSVSGGSPPISQTLFYSHCYDCQPGCDRSKWTHRCTISNKPKTDLERARKPRYQCSPELLSRVPKRFEEWIPEDVDYEVAFGLSSFELPNFWGFIFYSFLCFFFPTATFWVVWMKILENSTDLQGASVPIALGAIVWVLLFQSIAGKGWCERMQY